MPWLWKYKENCVIRNAPEECRDFSRNEPLARALVFRSLLSLTEISQCFCVEMVLKLTLRHSLRWRSLLAWASYRNDWALTDSFHWPVFLFQFPTYVEVLQTKYRIYLIKRPTSNKRPPTHPFPLNKRGPRGVSVDYYFFDGYQSLNSLSDSSWECWIFPQSFNSNVMFKFYFAESLRFVLNYFVAK